jgi:hypothetical protein
MAPAFNPIDYSSALEAAGVTREQAAVHAKALSCVLVDVVFAHDLNKLEANLRKEILQCEERVTLRIESARSELSTRIDGLRTTVDAKFESVDAKFKEMKCDIERLRTETNSRIDVISTEMVIYRWALGISMAMNATTLALVTKLLLT